MSKTNDGGPAFARAALSNPNGQGSVINEPGMSLRDWFAGQAMIGDLSRDGSALDLPAGRRALARKAYEIADAMLAARDV